MDQANRLRELVRQHRQPRIEMPMPVDTRTSTTRVMVVTSGKGGVGKSNITLNLSLALHNKGRRVLILDTDIGFSNIDVLMGRSSQHHLIEALEKGLPFESLVEKSSYGFSYISGGRGFNQLPELNAHMIEQFAEQLSCFAGELDYLMIDTGAGLSALDLKMMLYCDDILVVTTPEPTAITDAYAVIKMVAQRDPTRRFNVIVNRATKKEGLQTANNLISVAKHFLGVDIFYSGYLSDDAHVVKAVKSQRPFLAAYPESTASYNMLALAQRFQTENQDKRMGIRQFLHHLFLKKGGG